MPYFVTYDPSTGKIQDYYHSDKNKDIPESAIEISEKEYIDSVFDRKDWKIDPTTKALQRNRQE